MPLVASDGDKNKIGGGPLTTHDLTNAHNKLVKLLQLCYFPDEIRTLRTDRNSAVKGKVQRLNPFLDKDEILRVGDRLSHSPMPFTQKHPIILPKSSVTALIIEHEHLLNLHSGTQATLYALRRSYWPIDGRSQVWSTLKKCVCCCRANPPPVDYVLGDLPAARITESRPFTNVGIDYCGPFYIKERKDRNRLKIKVYVAIFVCLAVKAVHLELVTDNVIVYNVRRYDVIVHNVIPYNVIVYNITTYYVILHNVIRYYVIVYNVIHHTVMQYNVIHYNVIVSNVIRYSVIVYNVIRYNLIVYSVTRHIVLQYNVRPYNVALYNVIRYMSSSDAIERYTL